MHRLFPQDQSRLAACPLCQNFPLDDAGSELVCNSCHSHYPVAGGVPILIPGVTRSPRPVPSDEFIGKISAALQLPVAREFGDRIRSVFSSAWIIPSLGLHAESTQFLERLRSGGYDVPLLDEPEVAPIRKNGNGAKPNGMECRWLLHYIPPALPACRRGSWNVRFENTGPHPISSFGDAPVWLSYYWRSTVGAVINGLATPLPVEIAPGRQITIPMLMETPETGRYRLNIGMIDEDGEFTLMRSLPIQVETNPRNHAENWNRREIQFDYDADHHDAIELTMERIKALGIERPRILEIGGNAGPMIRDFRGELYNVDVDVHGMQMGYLIDRESDGSIRFYVADANALPFPNGFFDVILVFSSVHHMPDPRASLRHYASRLKPEGLLGVLCEPVGHYRGEEIDATLRKELEKGLNEQTFSVEEWAGIFQSAGLREEEVIVDHGSIKAFLGRYF